MLLIPFKFGTSDIQRSMLFEQRRLSTSKRLFCPVILLNKLGTCVAQGPIYQLAWTRDKPKFRHRARCVCISDAFRRRNA